MSYSSITMETQQKSINAGSNACTFDLQLQQKKITTKYENLALEIKIIWKINNIYISLSHLSIKSGHQKLSKISAAYRLTKNIFNKSGAKSCTTMNMSYSKQTPRKCPLTLGLG